MAAEQSSGADGGAVAAAMPAVVVSAPSFVLSIPAVAVSVPAVNVECDPPCRTLGWSGSGRNDAVSRRLLRAAVTCIDS